MMVSGATNVFDVAGAKAFLSGCGFGKFEFNFTQEMVFELVHASRCKQHRFVPFGHHHIARADGVSLGFEEVQILVA